MRNVEELDSFDGQMMKKKEEKKSEGSRRRGMI